MFSEGYDSEMSDADYYRYPGPNQDGEYYVGEIIARRTTVNHDDVTYVQYLVLWAEWPPSAATWESTVMDDAPFAVSQFEARLTMTRQWLRRSYYARREPPRCCRDAAKTPCGPSSGSVGAPH